jgi:hypothetical protein
MLNGQRRFLTYKWVNLCRATMKGLFLIVSRDIGRQEIRVNRLKTADSRLRLRRVVSERHGVAGDVVEALGAEGVPVGEQTRGQVPGGGEKSEGPALNTSQGPIQ